MRTIIALLAIGIVAFATARAGAQPGPPPGRGPGPRGSAARTYDPKTVETVTGDVVEVEHVSSQRAGGGVHLTLRTEDQKTLAVHLGPAWWVDRQSVKLAPEDHIEVKGSRVTVDGQPAIIAAEVKKGAATLVLRDAAGVPAWSGRGAPP